MIWLGSRRGYLTDWMTQKWVQATRRRVRLEDNPWLTGPVGSPKGIGTDFFQQLAAAEGLRIETGDGFGLLQRFSGLDAPEFDVSEIHPGVVDFYEQTSAYDLDAWGEWCGLFRPFGWLLAAIFSRRLQQLNVPLSALDTSRGVTSDVFRLVDASGEVRLTAWVRKLIGTDNVLYAGSYSLCNVPRHPAPCVKVVFPLPNGNAMVIMRASVADNGSLFLESNGRGFGDPGFYFTVHDPEGRVWARFVKTFRETIHVYPSDDSVRADHALTIWRQRFLRLHYRLKRNPVVETKATDVS